MGTSLARKYLGTVWTLIALGTLGGYIETVRADGTVEGKDWGFVAAGLVIGLGLLFYDRLRGNNPLPVERAKAAVAAAAAAATPTPPAAPEAEAEAEAEPAAEKPETTDPGA